MKIKRFNEALETPCQTSGSIYDTEIGDKDVKISVKIPFSLNLSEDEAIILEKNLHNTLELVLKPYFIKEN